jgi:peroxiredoxin
MIAPDFSLKDQNDIEIQLSQFHGENVLLFGFDKDSADSGGTWLNLLVERYDDPLRILPIASGVSLPLSVRLFLRGKVKAELQDAAEEFNLSSFLLDWTGEVSRQYGISLETPTVVLIGRTGHIQLVHPLPPLTADEVRATFDRIDKQIR